MSARSSWVQRIFLCPAVAMALLVASWGVVKVAWEHGLHARQETLHLRPPGFTIALRQQLGQGMGLALLGGMRGIVADLTWLEAQNAWEKRAWFKLKNLVQICVTLQPRSVLFFEMGSWHLAWNASINKRSDPNLPGEPQRIREERLWAQAGETLVEEGLAINPVSQRLWLQLALLRHQRLKDYAGAAEAYRQASLLPDAPAYAERFVGYFLEKAGLEREAYEHWKRMWQRPEVQIDPSLFGDKIAERIRKLETSLNIPAEQRILLEFSGRGSQ
jgi:tetratricopeptide (TPR) repeat protein